VRVLLELGANITDKAPDGSGPIAIAVANAHYELAGFLLDKGADPTAATEGWTTLHQLVRTRTPSRGRLLPVVGYDAQAGLDLAAKLIERGADVNARMTKDVDDGYRLSFDRKGATPFFFAAKGLDVKMMRLLLAHGADPKLTVTDGTTALMAAAGLGSGAPGEDGTDEDAVEAVKFCLDVCGNDVNAVTKDGWTALHGAASRGVNAIVQMLIDRGAMLNPKTREGITPIQMANAWSPDPTHVYRQPQTVALLREAMTAHAVSFEEPGNPLLPPSRAGGRQR
jgi:ankyrin repeat protein